MPEMKMHGGTAIGVLVAVPYDMEKRASQQIGRTHVRKCRLQQCMREMQDESNCAHSLYAFILLYERRYARDVQHCKPRHLLTKCRNDGDGGCLMRENGIYGLIWCGRPGLSHGERNAPFG